LETGNFKKKIKEEMGG